MSWRTDGLPDVTAGARRYPRSDGGRPGISANMIRVAVKQIVACARLDEMSNLTGGGGGGGQAT